MWEGLQTTQYKVFVWSDAALLLRILLFFQDLHFTPNVVFCAPDDFWKAEVRGGQQTCWEGGPLAAGLLDGAKVCTTQPLWPWVAVRGEKPPGRAPGLWRLPHSPTPW